MFFLTRILIRYFLNLFVRTLRNLARIKMSEIPISVMPWHRPDPCKPSKNQTDAAFKATYIDYLSSLSLESPTLAVPLTGIMCTIGPSTKQMDVMVDLMQQGMSLALVPLSLGVRQDHIDTVTTLRSANIAYNQTTNRVYPLGIALQTKGPGLRIGGLKKDVPIGLALQHKVTLTTEKTWRTKGTEHYLYVNFPEMSHVLNEGDHLLIGPGAVILAVETIDEHEVVCQVVGGGEVTSYMSVSIPDVPLRLPDLTDEDVDDLRLACSLGVDIVVATKTQNANHLREVRKILEEEDNGSGIKVWAQLETKMALDNLESILEEADAVLLSRVSLTQDMPPEKLFLAQKMVLASCNKAGVPVFVSSHFLPSMQREIQPSIAELGDVAAAILDGADGFALRNTTAIGRHPEQAVKTLVKTCLEAEAALWHHQTFAFLNASTPPPIDPTHAIAISAVEASLKASAAAIFMATTSGRSAQLVARYRPRCPIIAVSRYGQVARQLNTWRGVVPLHYVDAPLPDWTREVDSRLQFGIEFAKLQGIVTPGDCLVLLNGWRQGAGFTNTIRIVYASDSFPWVYPHQLPPILPSDRDIADEPRMTPDLTDSRKVPQSRTASKLVPGMSSVVPGDDPPTNRKVVKVPLMKVIHLPLPGGTDKGSVHKSMEIAFESIASSGSKVFSERGLVDSVNKSRTELLSQQGDQGYFDSNTFVPDDKEAASRPLSKAASQKSKDSQSIVQETKSPPLSKTASQKSKEVEMAELQESAI